MISPGSRSTPLSLSAHAAGLEIVVHIDERVAAFGALGHAKATGVPAVLIATSGTAGVNYQPAVVEAHHSGVPMIVCTADRPPELRMWGAGQTVQQNDMYGAATRWFHELPVASDVDETTARAVALRSVTVSVQEAGPVHLNWPFREPLTPNGPLVAPVPEALPPSRPQPSATSLVLSELAHAYERGLIVVGPCWLEPAARAEIEAFALHWGWPIVADPASGMRVDTEAVVSTGEFLFATPTFVDAVGPADGVVRVGGAPTSKSYRLWIESHPVSRLVLVDPGVEWADPSGSVTDIVPGPVQGAFGAVEGHCRISDWWSQWRAAQTAAAAAVQGELAAGESEIALARQLVSWLDSGEPATLVVSNSMPIRDLDAAMAPVRPQLRVLANRGANGIDGVIATAAGAAMARPSHRVVVLIGDVATVHDLGGLAAAARHQVKNLTVVVVDNNAGGIFSFLPVVSAIDPETFTELFATPHGTDLGAVARSLGYDVAVLDSVAEIASTFERLASDVPGFVCFKSTAQATTDAMSGLRAAVARSVDVDGQR